MSTAANDEQGVRADPPGMWPHAPWTVARHGVVSRMPGLFPGGQAVTVARPVQGSLIEGMERPAGPILKSVFRGTNADLMAAIAPLYLAGSVLDVTYGRGKWWDRFKPEPFSFHDIAVDGVDFRELPESDGSIDTVCYDPPYIRAGGAATVDRVRGFRNGFGLTAGRTSDELDDLVLDGLSECCRVSARWVLVKCMEFVGSAAFVDMPTRVTNAMEALGWVVHDRIVHDTGTGPGGHNIFTVKRARRAHSYLIVFTREEMAKR